MLKNSGSIIFGHQTGRKPEYKLQTGIILAIQVAGYTASHCYTLEQSKI